MTSQITFHSFDEPTSLIEALSRQITTLLATAIQHNRRASLAVSGGSTPVDLFKKLSTIDINWHNVDIALVDERWVDPNDTDSNENLVRTHLLQNRAAAAFFKGMKNSAATAEQGEQECEEQLSSIQLPFDVLILGLGNDGHTASLFPGAKKLAQATDMDSRKTCLAITPLTAPHERMTLTLPAILRSKNIFLHITGQAKKDVLDLAFTDGFAEEMPIRYILRHQEYNPKPNNPLNIYWAK